MPFDFVDIPFRHLASGPIFGPLAGGRARTFLEDSAKKKWTIDKSMKEYENFLKV
jgi:hypothetical protein